MFPPTAPCDCVAQMATIPQNAIKRAWHDMSRRCKKQTAKQGSVSASTMLNGDPLCPCPTPIANKHAIKIIAITGPL